jgi:hypothetical protein
MKIIKNVSKMIKKYNVHQDIMVMIEANVCNVGLAFQCVHYVQLARVQLFPCVWHVIVTIMYSTKVMKLVNVCHVRSMVVLSVQLALQLMEV